MNGSQVLEAAIEQKDDFKLIHGIREGIEERLRAAGVDTYARLAGMSPEEIVQVVGNLPALTTRIKRDRWIEQARELAASKIQDNAMDRQNRQHTANFTIELLLDEENKVRRTQIVYIQDEKKEPPWAGWSEAKLISFIKEKSQILSEESEPSSPEDIETETAVEQPVIKGEVRLGDLQVTSLQTGYRGRILGKDRPAEINLVLDLTGLGAPDESTIDYVTEIYAKELGKGINYKIGEVQGSFKTADQLELTFAHPALKEGMYRIGLNLALIQSPTEPNVLPEFTKSLDAGLLMVY